MIVHLSGEVEIGASDGSKRVLRAGDIRFMEDTSGKGHTHLGPVSECSSLHYAYGLTVFLPHLVFTAETAKCTE